MPACIVCAREGLIEGFGAWKECKGCPAVAHSSCMPSFDGFCPSCEREQCGVCGLGRLLADDHVVCGNSREGCERVFHLSCVSLDEVPEDDWFCESCEDAAASERRSRQLQGRTRSVEERDRRDAVRAALEEFERTKMPDAWLKAREAKMALFRQRAMPSRLSSLKRIRLISFSYLRRRKPTAHETQDVRLCVRHPASKDNTMLAIATPSLRYLRSWGPSRRRRLTNSPPVTKAERVLKRGAEFQRCVTSPLKDGTDASVQQFLSKHDQGGLSDLIKRAQFLAHTWTDGTVLTLAYGDHLGVMRSVAVVELVGKALRDMFRANEVKIDTIHLDLRSVFLEHFRHASMLASKSNNDRAASTRDGEKKMRVS